MVNAGPRPELLVHAEKPCRRKQARDLRIGVIDVAADRVVTDRGSGDAGGKAQTTIASASTPGCNPWANLVSMQATWKAHLGATPSRRASKRAASAPAAQSPKTKRGRAVL